MTIDTVNFQPSHNDTSPFLFAGLGNPGREYRDTRHNVGFMVLDRLAEKIGINFSRVEMKSLVTKTDHKGSRLVLAKPQTYMNLCGASVQSLLHYYKVEVPKLIVIYDEVDLPLGALRIRPGGGSAGHKGVESIIAALGTDEIPRLRVGIGRPPGKKSAANYVLKNFAKNEHELLLITLDKAVDALFMFVEAGLEAAMNHYNTTVND